MMGRPGGGMIRAAGIGRPGLGQPPERSKDLRGTVRRLLARLRPERVRLVIVLVFGVTSVALLVTGPKILGAATNVLFDGVVGKQLPAGITQRTMYGLRREVEEKLARLPLRYFDSHPHGDILSRVTNDIDNLSTTLQQGLNQLLTSVLTIIGVMGMMFWISPLLAAVSVITIPLALVVTFLIARHSQVQFADQWDRTGTLNGLVEETHTGHALVQVFGRRRAAIDEFTRQNQQLYQASFRAQFLSGVIQPSMQFLANLNYVVIAVLGGYW